MKPRPRSSQRLRQSAQAAVTKSPHSTRRSTVATSAPTLLSNTPSRRKHPSPFPLPRRLERYSLFELAMAKGYWEARQNLAVRPTQARWYIRGPDMDPRGIDPISRKQTVAMNMPSCPLHTCVRIEQLQFHQIESHAGVPRSLNGPLFLSGGISWCMVLGHPHPPPGSSTWQPTTRVSPR